MGFAEEVKKAVDLVGARAGDAFADLLADPGRGCVALDALGDGEGIVLRMAPALGAASPGYAKAPREPLWVRVMRGAREVGTAALRGGEGQVRRVRRVELEAASEPCCDAATCDRRKTRASVWLVLEAVEKNGADTRLLAAEQRVDDEKAPAIAEAVAARLAAVTTAPLERSGAASTIDPASPPPAPEPLGPTLDVVDLARYAMRSESDERVVLRDFASVGPRASAGRTTWIGLVLGAIAVGFGVQLARVLQGGGGERGAAIAFGALAALFALASYAFLGVARFAAQYSARSSPLLAVGRDRIVVLPWVSRDGAVDLRPEGRLGAAIPLGETRAASVTARDDRSAIELDTDHGAIDALVTDRADVATFWCAALNRAIDEARHPRSGATAKQRARQRAQAHGD